MKSRRVGDAWSRKRTAAREAGQAMTARCPGWIRLVGGPRTGRYELVPDRAEVVRRIFDDTIGGDGRRTIVRRLNAAQVEPWGMGASKGAYWHDSYVAKILSSPAAFGTYEKGGEASEGYFPAAVTEETFWRAQAAVRSRKVGEGRTARQFANLLSGMAACPSCGGNMAYVDKGSRSRPILRCASAHARGGCDMRDTIAYEGLESVLIHAYAHMADVAMFAVAEDARRAEADLGGHEGRRAELVARRDRLIAALEEGVSIPAVRARLDLIGADIAAAEERIAATRAAMAEAADIEEDIEMRVDAISNLVHAADPEARYRGRAEVNRRMRRIIKRLVMHLQGGGFDVELQPGMEGADARMLQLYKRTDGAEAPRR